jgi:hypothetical protein
MPEVIEYVQLDPGIRERIDAYYKEYGPTEE